METIIYKGDNYNLTKISGDIKIFLEEDCRRCIITDIDNNVLSEISVMVVQNVGFVEVL